MKTRALAFTLVLGSYASVACDDKPAATLDAATAASATVSATASAPPPPPKPPIITLDDGAFVATGDKVDMSAADAKGRIVAMLANKTLVVGQTLELDALRDTTMPRFMIAIDALHDAKAKALTIKTAQRDRTMGTLNVTLDHGAVSSCAAVAMVTKDNAINVWPYAGAVAQRFSHGFAGPDITLGSAAFAKLANACDSSYDFVAGDDAIKWGVVFDLAVAAAQTPAFKPTSTVVLAKTPVPGIKIKE